MSCKYCSGEVGSHIKIDKHPAAIEKIYIVLFVAQN